MASAVTVQRIGSRQYVQSYIHIPNSTAATVLTYNQGTNFVWLDMSTFSTFLVVASNAILTGNGLTLLEIVAAVDNIGTNTTQIVSSGVLTGTTVPKGASLEIEAAQLREVGAPLGYALRYVSARLTVANASDELCVALVREAARQPQQNLTPLTF